jgi:hypothetical protein
MSLIVPHEHGYITIRNFPSREKELYTRLTQARVRDIGCIPHDIHERIMILDPIVHGLGHVHVPAQPLEAALQKIGMNTQIIYGFHGTRESNEYQYFREALNLFRDHVRQNNTFIRANLDVAVNPDGETWRGAPVQLNFIMLEEIGNKLKQFGKIVHINLDGMFTE